jgi:hypothetical protein
MAGRLAGYVVEDYESFVPVLDRLSTERRVLGFITDEDHMGRGPRNTVGRLSFELELDEFTDHAGDLDEMRGFLDTLEAVGLVEQAGGVYSLTDLGLTELAN